VVTKKKTKEPDMIGAYRQMTDSLMAECNDLHSRIWAVRIYLDKATLFGFVRAGSVRRILVPGYENYETDLFRYWREAKEYIKEVCF